MRCKEVFKMRPKVLKILFIFIFIFILGGLSYSKALNNVSLKNVMSGSLIISQLLLIYFIISSITLFVFTSIVFRNDSNTLKTRLEKIIYAVLLSYSPLIILFVTLDFVQYFNFYKIGIKEFIIFTTFILKGITPIMLFLTFWKSYKIDFFKSCLLISSYFILLMVITEISSII